MTGSVTCRFYDLALAVRGLHNGNEERGVYRPRTERTMAQVDRKREAELAAAVQHTKAELLALLTPDEQKVTRRSDGHYVTFEERAAEIVAYIPADTRQPAMAKALEAYQGALNNLWAYAYTEVIPAMVSWWKKTRRVARAPIPDMLDTDDLISEAAVAVRAVLHRFDPTQATLRTFGMNYVQAALTLVCRRAQIPVEVSERVARSIEPGTRVLLDTMEGGFSTPSNKRNRPHFEVRGERDKLPVRGIVLTALPMDGDADDDATQIGVEESAR